MAGMVSGSVATHSMARSSLRERMCTITMVGTSSTSMISTVTTHSASEAPRPLHRVLRSAPSALPSPVKMAIHGSKLHFPDNGCRMVNRNMDTSGTNRNSSVTVRMMVLTMRCLPSLAARSCGGMVCDSCMFCFSCDFALTFCALAFTAIVLPSFPRRG